MILRVGYGKIGRSMPLSLAKCGSLGGDVEMAATVKVLAERNPQHEFWLIGRNTGEDPVDVGLPSNVINPWTRWIGQVRAARQAARLNKPNLTIEDHLGVQAIFDSITLPTITSMHKIILWAGQHGTTNAPLPSVRRPGTLTKPHDWSAHYVAFLTRGVNRWRDPDPWNTEEIWLNSDPRNYLKLRDLKWPLRHPVLAQHTYRHNIKHARYDDPGPDGAWAEWSAEHDVGLAEPGDINKIWFAAVDNVYSRLEINGLLPGTPFGDLVSFDDRWENRTHFGLFINETRKYVRADVARLRVMQEWVLPLSPTWVHGTWSKESLAELGRDIKPAPWEDYFDRLHSVRCTFTTPASGTGWATAKPWEAFAAGTVCFFHPEYDTQNNILGDAPPGLLGWLRVNSPTELRQRVQHLQSYPEDWLWIVNAQRQHFEAATKDPLFLRLIEERLGASTTQ